MRKIAFIALVLFFGSSTLLHCQTILKNSSDINGYKNLTKEGIFLHYNASLLFAGEYLIRMRVQRNNAQNQNAKGWS